MKNSNLLLLVLAAFLFSCSSEDPDVELASSLIGGWKLDRIKVEGADCVSMFGENVPDEYVADEEGCATPTEVLGNASRCINLDLRENGEGTFLWSEITGGEDAEITYTVMDGEFEYCFVGSSCSGDFFLVGENLEASFELGLEEDCNVIYVLKRK